MRTVRRGYVAVEEGPVMDKKCNVSTLAMFATALEQRPEAEVRRALQAVIEGKPLGESSLDSKLVDYGLGCMAQADQIMVLGNVKYRRHVNGGGWVPADQDESDPKKAYVSEEAYIAPGVTIEGNTKIFGGEFYGGEFYGGQFFGGEFYAGEFNGGEFNCGTFNNGVFHSGRFIGGTFAGDRLYLYATIGKKYGSSEDADRIL